MANNYTQCTPDRSLKCTKQQAHKLISLLNEEEGEDICHGFIGEYYSKDGEFYFYAETSGSPEELPKKFTKLLGTLMTKNKVPYVTIGGAFYCDKLRPGEFGGFDCRIYPDGEIVWPKIMWPERKV